MTDDLEFFDGTEAVALTIGSNLHEIMALRRPMTSHVETGVQTERAAWHVRAEDLDGDVPTVDCELTVGAETWVVVATERLSFGTRYRLVCERTA